MTRRLEVDVAYDGGQAKRGFAALGQEVDQLERKFGSAQRSLRELDSSIAGTKREILELDQAQANPEVALDDSEYKRQRKELQLSLAGLRQEKLEIQVEYRDLQAADKRIKQTSNSLTDLRAEGSATQKALSGIIPDSVSLLKLPTMIAAVGAAAQGVSALGAGAVSLTSALTPLAGLLGAAPALYGAYGQAAGVVALAGIDDLTSAVGGLNEELDEEADAFKALSPAAQEFARQIEAAKGPFRELQEMAQESLFAGISDGFEEARRNMGVLDTVVQATAGSLGYLAREAGEFAGRRGFGRDIEQIGLSNARVLRMGGEAALNFGDALRHVTVEAQPLVRWLGESLVGFSEWTAEQARAARQSGELGHFFDETRGSVERLTSIGGSLASVLWEIGKAAKPLGDDILESLDEGADDLERWAESARGRDDLREFFERARDPIYEAGRLIGDATESFFRLSQTPGLTDLIKTLRVELLPVMEDMIAGTTRAFGPHVIEMLAELGKTFSVFAGSSGPLIHFVDLITALARGFNKLLGANEGLQSVVVSLVGFAGVVKAMKFAGAITGISALTRTLGGVAPAAKGAEQALGKGSILGRLIGLGGGAGGAVLGGAAAVGGMTLLVTTLDDLQKTDLEQLRGRFEHLDGAIDDLGGSSRRSDGRMAGLRKELEAYADALREVDAAPVIAQGGGKGGMAVNINDSADQVKKVLGGLKDEYGTLLHAATRMSKGSRDAMIDFARAARESGQITDRQFSRLWDIFQNTEERNRDLWRRIGKVTGEGAKDVEKSLQGMKVQVSKQYAGMVEASLGEITLLMSNTGSAMKALGARQELKWAVDRHKTGPTGGGYGNQSRRLGGAIVPGTGSGDIFGPVMLPPQAGVLNRNAVNAFFGLQKGGMVPTMLEPGERVFDQWTPTLELMNNLVGRQKGGTVGGDTAGLHSGILGLVSSLASRFGGTVTSGVRSTDTGSIHSTGRAADYVPDDWAGAAAAVNRVGASLMEGIYNPGTFGGPPVSWDSGAQVSPSFWADEWGNHLDHIHLAIDDGVKLAAKAVERNLKRGLLKGPEGGLRDTGQAAIDMVWRAGQDLLDRLAAQSSDLSHAAGKTVPGKPIKSLPAHLEKWNVQYPFDSSETMPYSAIRQLAAWQGLPDWFWKITIGESGGQPGAVGYDKGGTMGYGLYQETTGFADAFVRAVTGGLDYNKMLNPVLNTMAAKMHYDAAPVKTPNVYGFPWYGTSGLQGGGAVGAAHTPLDKDIKNLADLLKALSKGGGQISLPEKFDPRNTPTFEGTEQAQAPGFSVTGTPAPYGGKVGWQFDPDTSAMEELLQVMQDARDELRSIRAAQEDIRDKSIAGHLAVQALTDAVDNGIGVRGAAGAGMAGAGTLGTGDF